MTASSNKRAAAYRKRALTRPSGGNVSKTYPKHTVATVQRRGRKRKLWPGKFRVVLLVTRVSGLRETADETV